MGHILIVIGPSIVIGPREMVHVLLLRYSSTIRCDPRISTVGLCLWYGIRSLIIRLMCHMHILESKTA